MITDICHTTWTILPYSNIHCLCTHKINSLIPHDICTALCQLKQLPRENHSYRISSPVILSIPLRNPIAKKSGVHNPAYTVLHIPNNNIITTVHSLLLLTLLLLFVVVVCKPSIPGSYYHTS